MREFTPGRSAFMQKCRIGRWCGCQSHCFRESGKWPRAPVRIDSGRADSNWTLARSERAVELAEPRAIRGAPTLIVVRIASVLGPERYEDPRVKRLREHPPNHN